jgi:hypothetical protein
VYLLFIEESDGDDFGFIVWVFGGEEWAIS